jgi:hypothetical protein
MEILKTFIVEKGSMGNDKRFVKVYLTVGKKYFLQVPQGAMYEISETEFKELSDNTWKSLH